MSWLSVAWTATWRSKADSVFASWQCSRANRTISKYLCCGRLKQERNVAAHSWSRPSIHIIGTRIAHAHGCSCDSTPRLYRSLRYAATPPPKSAKIVSPKHNLFILQMQDLFSPTNAGDRGSTLCRNPQVGMRVANARIIYMITVDASVSERIIESDV